MAFYDRPNDSINDPLITGQETSCNEVIKFTTTLSQQEIMLHDRASKILTQKRNLFLFYCMLLIVYIGINIALLFANIPDADFIEEHYFLIFHMTEFWAVAIFSFLEALILISTEVVSSLGQMALIWANCLAAFITVMLFSIYPEHFEVPAHYMEYSVQITITLVNFIFIISIKDKTSILYKYRNIELGVATGVIVLSILQLIVYSGLWDWHTDAERASHFMEFSNEAINGFFALFFAFATYNDFDTRVKQHRKILHPDNYEDL